MACHLRGAIVAGSGGACSPDLFACPCPLHVVRFDLWRLRHSVLGRNLPFGRPLAGSHGRRIVGRGVIAGVGLALITASVQENAHQDQLHSESTHRINAPRACQCGATPIPCNRHEDTRHDGSVARVARRRHQTPGSFDYLIVPLLATAGAEAFGVVVFRAAAGFDLLSHSRPDRDHLGRSGIGIGPQRALQPILAIVFDIYDVPEVRAVAPRSRSDAVAASRLRFRRFQQDRRRGEDPNQGGAENHSDDGFHSPALYCPGRGKFIGDSRSACSPSATQETRTPVLNPSSWRLEPSRHHLSEAPAP